MQISLFPMRMGFLALFFAMCAPGLMAITILPTQTTVTENATEQFQTNTAATWETDCGSISETGLLKAPLYPKLCTVTATAADGSGSVSAAVNVISPITMMPAYAKTAHGTTQQFTASAPVTWTAKCGAITSAGLYTASAPGNTYCTIEGTAASGTPYTVYGYDETLTGSGNGATVAVTPVSTCALPSHSQQFTAQVTNTPNTAVSWYVDNVLNGNGTVGTVSSSGLYASPATVGSHVLKAVSTADASASGAASIAVTNSPAFAIVPSTASVPVSGSQTFAGQMCNAVDTNVTYSVDNIAGGNSAVGTVDNNGLYTAPGSEGQHTILATDTSINQTASAKATVSSGVSVDFGSRTYHSYPIPANLLGVNHADNVRTDADARLVAGAVSSSRTYALIPVTYATRTPNWTGIDRQIAILQQAGLHPTIEMAFSPPWLQPNPNPCGSGNDTVTPTSVSAWANIAAAYVAHMDAQFPGFVREYEIWNEPNAGGLCSNNKLNDYLRIYSAAAPLMKQQAAADGVSIRIGGPATAGLDETWISALLANATTAPYVDFVSYHQYFFGSANIHATWNTSQGGESLYQVLQSTGNGAAALFSRAAALVKSGKQPLGEDVPIYIDEYNTNYAFLTDCCRNSPTYSPLFNALYVSDVLNTVYSGAQGVPARLDYYATDAHPFCLVGTWNSSMDCYYSSGVTPVPYPQYYLYQLLSSPTYLGLRDGGYMAAAVTPASGGAGLAVTGFYSTTGDSILITNPTGTSYPQLSVQAKRVGLSSPRADLYQIVGGKSISQSSLPLKLSSDGTTYTATISAPAYTVLAISIRGN